MKPEVVKIYVLNNEEVFVKHSKIKCIILDIETQEVVVTHMGSDLDQAGSLSFWHNFFKEDNTDQFKLKRHTAAFKKIQKVFNAMHAYVKELGLDKPNAVTILREKNSANIRETYVCEVTIE